MASNRDFAAFYRIDYCLGSGHSEFVNFDISHILDDWDFQPGKVMVRRFKGRDGVDKIQLRLDLGIVQMNAYGRPDGKHPHGQPTLLDYYRAQTAKKKAEEAAAEFEVDEEGCTQLHLEAMQYHHRCLCQMELEDFDGVVQDANRMLEILDFVAENGAVEDVFWRKQIGPQAILMRTRASGSQKLRDHDFDGTLADINQGIEEIRSFWQELGEGQPDEPCDEIHSLENWLESIQNQRPLSPREKLEIALGEAVEREDYEKAAYYRDMLRKLSLPRQI
jgi:hypothetical protein